MSISWALDDAKRIVDWDDAGRLADDEWLVERNEAAIIAIARALLSTSSALEFFANPPTTEPIAWRKAQERARAALSVEEGKEQARSPSALSASTDRLQSKE